jgi:hypothetical protein
MRQIVLRALVILACVAVAHCGGDDDDSNPTNPTPPPSGGGGGGGGGGTVTAPTTDTEFDDGQWQDLVEQYGAGGTGGGGRLTYLGQPGAYYRQVRINVNNAGSGSAAQVAVFSYKQNAVYFPTTDGAILSIDYSESSINQSSGNVQYSAPAIRQNGKNYTLVPGGKAFTIPETSWTTHSLTGLTQNDFRTIATPSDHPDFSANGSRIEVGFMRLQVVQPNASNAETRAGIDNYQLVLIRRN